MRTETDEATSPDSTGTRAAAGWWAPACISIAVAAFASVFGYLYFAASGPMFGAPSAQQFLGARMTLSRGSGRVHENALVVLATDASNIAIVSLELPHLSAGEYRRVRWIIKGARDDNALALLWRSAQAPGKTNTAPLTVSNNTAEASFRPGEGTWTGDIDALALAIRGPLREPLIVEGVSIDSMSASDIIDDRLDDWLTLSPWNGLSINTAFGGAQEQPVWLPIAVAIVALTAIALWRAWGRWHRPGAAGQASLVTVAIIAAAWITLDARWLWLRFQQTQVTGAAFAGKSVREKHIADVDGYLYAFAEQVRARLPQGASRIYVAADDHYFGARMAYHLFPNNVYVDHGTGALPPPGKCRPGEYVVVFRRHGVKYDTASQMLIWDDQPPVHAQLLLAHQGNAMFRLL